MSPFCLKLFLNSANPNLNYCKPIAHSHSCPNNAIYTLILHMPTWLPAAWNFLFPWPCMYLVVHIPFSHAWSKPCITHPFSNLDCTSTHRSYCNLADKHITLMFILLSQYNNWRVHSTALFSWRHILTHCTLLCLKNFHFLFKSRAQLFKVFKKHT